MCYYWCIVIGYSRDWPTVCILKYMLLFATILKYMFFYTCVIMTIKRDMQALMNEGVNACLSNTMESLNLSQNTLKHPKQTTKQIHGLSYVMGFIHFILRHEA